MNSIDIIDKEINAIILIQTFYRCYCVRKLYCIANNHYEQICNDILNEIKHDIPNYESYKYGKYANRIDKVGDIFLFEVINETKPQDNDKNETLFNDNKIEETAIILEDIDETTKSDNDVVHHNIDIVDNEVDYHNIDIVRNEVIHSNIDNKIDEDLVFHNKDQADKQRNNELTDKFNFENIHNNSNNIYKNANTIINNNNEDNNNIPSEIKLALLKAEEQFLKQSLIDRIKYLKNNKNS